MINLGFNNIIAIIGAILKNVLYYLGGVYYETDV